MQRERFVPTDLGQFIETDLFPALWLQLDAAFPEFRFQRKGHFWQAAAEEATRALPGSPRPDRVQAYEDTPFGFKIHGGAFIPWLSYISGEQTPRGPAFIDAVRALSERAGVPFPERPTTPEETQRLEASTRRGDLMEAFVAYAVQALESDAGENARAYLAQRGFDPEWITALQFGLYTTDDEVLATLREQGFSVEEVRDAALVPPAFDTGSASIHLWRGRAVGPWRARSGRIINLWARDITGEAEDHKKYLMLRGGSKAAPFGSERVRSRDLILVEGFLDCLSLHAAGQDNVVALGGAALTEEQIETLSAARIHSLTLNLDYDGPGGAGEKAILQALERLARAAFSVYIVNPVDMADNGNVYDKVDPDQYVRTHGIDGYRELIAKAVKGPVYRAQRLLAAHDLTTDRGRDDAVAQIIEYTGKLSSELDREDALRATAAATGYTEQALDAALQDHAQREAGDRTGRELRRALDHAQGQLLRRDNDAQQVADEVLGHLLDLRRRNATEGPAEFSVDAIIESIQSADEGKVSGWHPLDDLGVRFHPSELAVLGARTGHGKTTALLSLLINWLEAYPEERFVFFSYELPPEAVLLKLASTLTRRYSPQGWTYYEIRDWLQGRERANHFGNPESLEQAFDFLRACEDRLAVVYRPGWSVTELAAHAHGLAAQGQPPSGILVDYLQLVGPPEGQYDRRDIEVSQVARHLKALAVALSCPVLAAAQIGRQAAQQAERIPPGDFDERSVQEAIRRRRPQLHHLREGGSEQEADVVLGLLNYRADYLEDRGNGPADRDLPGPFEVLVLKNRYGPLGTARMVLEGPTGTLRELELGEEWYE